MTTDLGSLVEQETRQEQLKHAYPLNERLSVEPLIRPAVNDLAVARAMIRFGGDFVQCLGRAAQRADQNNMMRLRNAFADYWQKYADLVPQMIAEDQDE